MRYLLLLAAVIVAMAGYTIYWFVLADRLDAAVQSWIAERRAEGLRVSDEGRKSSGFPGLLTISIVKPAIGSSGEFVWAWHGALLKLHMQPWDLSHVIFDVGSANDLTWTAHGAQQESHVATSRALASMILSGGEIERMDVDIRDLASTGAGLGGQIAAGRLQLHERTNHGEDRTRPPNSFEVAVEAEGLVLPSDIAGPLGPSVPTLSVDAMMAEPLPRGLDRMAAWRDDGGSITFNSVNVVWGPLDARGSGTLTLDKEMRPLGAFAAEIRGLGGVIDTLVKAGQLRATDARTAKIALGLLSARDDKGAQVLSAPITAQDGKLFVGPIALLRLLPLPLPQASPSAPAPASEAAPATSSAPVSPPSATTAAPPASAPLPPTPPASAPAAPPPPASAQNPVPAPPAPHQ
jgi:hypothetical protein